MFKHILSHLRKIEGLLTTPRSALQIALYSTVIALIINTTLTVVASTKFSENQGVRILFDGKCSKVSNLDTAIHVIINALSIILLTASNFTMQYISSPIRTELNKAHSKGDWMDVGVPSTRNLKRIDRRRTIAWTLLALTSVPLAVLYNCVTFTAVDSNDYGVYIVTEDFFSNPTYDANATHYNLIHSNEAERGARLGSDRNIKTGQIANSSFEIFMPDFIQDFPHSFSNLTRLSNKECIHKYSTRLLSGRRNLLAVTKYKNPSVPDFANNVTMKNLLYYDTIAANGGDLITYLPPYNYLCSALPGYLDNTLILCSPEMIDSTEWSLFGYKIEYCMSEIVPQHCLLLFSPHFSIAVIGCNLIKMLCIFFAVMFVKSETLCTQGDVLRSFLSIPDPSTMQLCLLNKSDVVSRQFWAPRLQKRYPYDPRIYRPGTHRWLSTASRRRWAFFGATASSSLAAVAFILNYVLQMLKDINISSLTSLWKLGFGNINSGLTINTYPISTTGNPPAGSLERILFLANLPQLLVSVLHLNYNGLFSCMLMEKEWTSLAYTRKPLRVSSPVQGQRSTYFLSLPYRYSIPLIIASGLMHWLVSQSMFLTQINPNGVFTSDYWTPGTPDQVGQPKDYPSAYSDGTAPLYTQDRSIRTWGYSPMPLVLIVALGSSMIVTLLLVGAKKYPTGMPPSGHCSAVLSAACQRLPEDEDITQRPVMLGVVNEDQGVQHCALSSSKVQPPALGALCR